MTPRQLELALQRQRLEWQAQSQREDLGRHLQILLPAFGAADKVRTGARFLRAHPEWLAGTAVVLAVLRPRRAWQWGKRGVMAWGLWKKVQSKLGVRGSTHAA